ncbi:aspartate kinase [Rivibacter subsaxonicus]|uniref:Amino acid kinase family protein n=1 Tax=Rivibacter subsaxonicus TaxID=457575 RepID=A0A4Q7W0H6_9BURK|nr:aspartate kinase [Rivibacter subsaxonicus]RZU02712.1 amino acid kinase family protein [Rivibacter subsaxonicus]
MWVLKLGGSLARDAEWLPRWLALVAGHGGGRVIVVPGGGSFADEVRAAQRSWRFDDRIAHNMAVLAMAQTAMLLQGLNPALQAAVSESQIRQALQRLQPAVWMPLELLRDQPDELTSWDISSDSLALWLARRLNAERLIVVKSCPVDGASDFESLADMGIVDRGFARLARDAAFPITLLHKAELEQMQQWLIDPGP